MTIHQLLDGADFLDVDGIAVARLPSGRCFAFETSAGAEPNSRPYPNERKAGMEGDELTRDEFRDWVFTGVNRFDVRS